MAKKSISQQVIDMPIEELSKLRGTAGQKQLQKYLRSLKVAYGKRKSSISKAGLYSHAIDVYEERKNARSLPINKMSRNQLIMEIVKLKSFFNSKTSSVLGIIDVNAQQDRRIFGEGIEDEDGSVKKELSDIERREFWKIYNEFMNQEKALVTAYSSEHIQQVLASSMIESEFSRLNFVDKLAALKDSLIEEKQQENGVARPNVLTGNRDDFTSGIS